MFLYLKTEKQHQLKRLENKIYKNISFKTVVETFSKRKANVSKKAYVLKYTFLNEKSIEKYSISLIVKPVKIFTQLNFNFISKSLKNFPKICLVSWPIHNSLLIFQNYNSLESGFEFFFMEFLKTIENKYFLENFKKIIFPHTIKVINKNIMKKKTGSSSDVVKKNFLTISKNSKNFTKSRTSTKFNKPFFEVELGPTRIFNEYQFKTFKSFTIKNWVWEKFDFSKKYTTKTTSCLNKYNQNYFNYLHSGVQSFEQFDKIKFRILNLLNFFKYDTSQKIYKNRVSSRSRNSDLLEKILLFDINMKKSFLLKVCLLFCFIIQKADFFNWFFRPIKHSFFKYVLNFDELKNLKKKKFSDIFVKVYFYQGFSFFLKKLFFLKFKNVWISDFKSSNCEPFLAVEKRLHFFLEQTAKFNLLNFNAINPEFVYIEKYKNKYVSLAYFLIHLRNVNHQSVSFYSYTALYDFIITSYQFKQNLSTMMTKPNSLLLNISNIPISLLEKKFYRTIENEFLNDSICRFFFDCLLRINFFYTSKSTLTNPRIVYFKISLTTSRSLLRSCIKVNPFFRDTFKKQDFLDNRKKINLFFVLFQKANPLRVEFCLYLYCLKTNIFLSFFKTLIFEKNINFLLKEFKRWLKSNDVDVIISNFNYSPVSKTRSIAFFLKKSGKFLTEFITSTKRLQERSFKQVYDTKLQFLYKIYKVRLLINQNFLVFLEKEDILNYVNQLKACIKSANSQSQYSLIKILSPQIYSWCYTYRFLSTENAFYYTDFQLFNFLWRWACKRHANKSRKWIFLKYFYFFEKKIYLFGILLKNSNTLSQTIFSKYVNLKFIKPKNCLLVSANSQKFVFVYLPFPSQVFKNLKPTI